MSGAYHDFLAEKAIAAGRRAHGSELEPKYFADAVRYLLAAEFEARETRVRLHAAEHALVEALALIEELHVQLDRANAAAVRMAQWADALAAGRRQRGARGRAI